VASDLHGILERPDPSLMSQELPVPCSPDELRRVRGGIPAAPGAIPAAAREIMIAESGGSTTCTNPSSTAFGAFQMTRENRIRYMGADFESTDFDKQYAAACAYVRDRYGGWEQAAAFWNQNHWY
jgi:hypothetical protein